ncbi:MULTISPECIES: class I SAM-dependent methyltransferase [unclassified Paracoccus (in: a-proteobacteria)]|uniref:class I SAM-dependent methyltransferase n=1 Tax=unclassified Paracoccus (in: a-proteobacteria) TaxID=2688777 RepID=UPI0012B1D1AA|nr:MULTISPECIES: SAM-dependent methyltransferase [unclassified Paracoccus (in: a-proteobacteria)]UXU75182.1 SAM-dependent methyltransferase [Paracoccus sp. SMMA_5]UXU81084.1 SAM-dependent methyltransferase [Paracoccus sp. SMMA_5_TC]
MTPLARLIAARIRLSGPMPLEDYMQMCLLHPQHGYYATRDPFGAAGDFTTAPEISQMFGEIVGLALAQAWLDQGRPDPFVLAELGPGRGTLMADILRAIGHVPGMRQAARLHLVEASPHLRRIQCERLGPLTHLDHAADLPDLPLFLVANEFFDALPIRQLQAVAGGWAPRLVTLDDAGRLGFALGAVQPGPPAPIGQIREYCPAALPIVEQIAARIGRHGGLAIVLDYGGWAGHGDTFQALRRHQPESPFDHPGEADLTAHVDFQPIAAQARASGAWVSRLARQGDWLLALGLAQRAARLQAAGDAGAMAALHRLTAPDEMGHLFKVLALWAPGAPVPPGFEPLDD